MNHMGATLFDRFQYEECRKRAGTGSIYAGRENLTNYRLDLLECETRYLWHVADPPETMSGESTAAPNRAIK
jgi:hypothetical protein